VITLKQELDIIYLLKQTNNNEGAIEMNKLGTLVLSSVVTLGIGAGGIVGNGVLASQAMEAGINLESPAIISQQNETNSYQKENTDKTNGADNEKVQQVEASITEDTKEKSAVVLIEKHGEEAKAYLSTNGSEKNNSNYMEGQPSANDISSKTAIDTGKKELIKKYALKSKLFKKFKITAKYYTKYEDITVPVWWVNFYPINNDEFNEIGCYQAILNASTGKVIKLQSAADGKG
jgi:hypothetical protein